jgi:hypothetical protein
MDTFTCLSVLFHGDCVSKQYQKVSFAECVAVAE